jgi:hypothetical protein
MARCGDGICTGCLWLAGKILIHNYFLGLSYILKIIVISMLINLQLISFFYYGNICVVCMNVLNYEHGFGFHELCYSMLDYSTTFYNFSPMHEFEIFMALC